jgi:hypothetical protein
MFNDSQLIGYANRKWISVISPLKGGKDDPSHVITTMLGILSTRRPEIKYVLVTGDVSMCNQVNHARIQFNFRAHLAGF